MYSRKLQLSGRVQVEKEHIKITFWLGHSLAEKKIYGQI